MAFLVTLYVAYTVVPVVGRLASARRWRMVGMKAGLTGMCHLGLLSTTEPTGHAVAWHGIGIREVRVTHKRLMCTETNISNTLTKTSLAMPALIDVPVDPMKFFATAQTSHDRLFVVVTNLSEAIANFDFACLKDNCCFSLLLVHATQECTVIIITMLPAVIKWWIKSFLFGHAVFRCRFFMTVGTSVRDVQGLKIMWAVTGGGEATNIRTATCHAALQIFQLISKGYGIALTLVTLVTRVLHSKTEIGVTS